VGSLTIITGSPGAGKTTLASRLAQLSPRGAHVAGDTFYTFLAHPIKPTLPESHRQNNAVIRAAVRSAAALANAGYEVFLDGIFGPWFLPEICEELTGAGFETYYLVLRVTLEQALKRAAERDPLLDEEAVRQMHGAFAQLGRYEAHVLDAGGMPPDELIHRVRQLHPALRLPRV